MEILSSSLVSNYEFKKNANNDIVAASFPMREHLNLDNNYRMLLGGSIEGGTARFDNLGIPAGLYLESKIFASHHNDIVKNSKHNNCVIDNDLFDKLLGNVSSVKPYSGTRRNQSNKKTKLTKKSTK